jgi:signal transduction histidine kinase
MIFHTEGVDSPYYAGLNLVIIAVSLLMPWTMAEVMTTCAFTLLFFLAAITGHAWVNDENLFSYNIRNLFNSIYFISLTAIICSTASFFLSKLRFGDWRLRYEVRLRNEELNESYKKLAELDRLKSEFFANVSHELRTPLTLILAPLDELRHRGGTGNPQTDDFLRIARENGLRLLRLINDMLDLVKLDAKGAELQRHAGDLAQLVPGIIHSAGHLARAKGLELSVDAPQEPLPADVDSNALEKILLNLFTNAVKFTPTGGRIDVALSRNGDSAVVEIKDSGIGISAADLPRIFDRFGQLDSSSTRQYSGIGIGLALSRELVEAHGGKITATSELQRGTTMRVSLPLLPPDSRVPDAESTAGTALLDAEHGTLDAGPKSSDSIAQIHRDARRHMAMPEKSDSGPMVPVGEGDTDVLVVEDEPEMRRFIVSLLKESYRVHQAADGIAGFDTAMRVKPKVTLLDVMLPGMDGLEVCRRLRKEPTLEGMKVVILTARSDEESKITALEHGAHDFLIKPFSTLELRTRVANLLKSAELEERQRRTNEELRTTLRTLRETEEQLIASEKLNALGTLAAGLLHEINNPLNFTLAATQLALMSVSDADKDVKEALTDAEAGMKRIKDIVTDLKTFAYPEKQHRQQVLAVHKVVEAARRIAAHNLHDIALVTDVPHELWVHASETQIVQVLINLLTNGARAIEKVPDRKGEIKIRAFPEGDRVRVCVTDNGTGISKESIAKVFDPFYTTREPGMGMGLGLSICQTIVRNHGGRIAVESDPGHWTEVCFDLPFASEEID